MLAQSILIVTKTRLDQTRLKQLVVREFVAGRLAQLPDLLSLPTDLAAAYESARNLQRVRSESYAGKREFRESLLGLYVTYDQPTLLYLGNLSDYSEQLQEGLLRLLEEPPENTTVVLSVASLSSVLPTIRSRTQALTLPTELVFALLDPALLEQVKAKLPAPVEAVKKLLQNTALSVDLKKVEREELDLWLWQLQSYLEQYYLRQPSPAIARALTRVVQASLDNEQNLQKKFVLETLQLTAA